MIRICAIDFLNRDSFESNIKLADGKVIISAGEKVTPELILTLYFKEIYVDKPLSDVIVNPTKSTSSSGSVEIPVVSYNESLASISETEAEPSFDLSKDESTLPQETPLDLSTKSSDSNAGIDAEMALPFDKTPEPAKLDLSVETPINTSLDKETDVKDAKYLNTPLPNMEKEVPDNPLEGGVDLGKKYSEEDEIPETDDKYGKSPVAPTLDLGETEAASAEPEPQVEEEPARVLKFDEDVAKEIAVNAVKLAKELNLAQNVTSDIEKAALICNIGLDNFKIEDLRRKDFELQKAKVSYDMAVKKGIYSNEVLEIVKSHAKPYISENFDLNSIVPACDVLHIASMYSRYLYVGMSKEKAILKMLQQGGNEYNIFALHKFLRLMRNE